MRFVLLMTLLEGRLKNTISMIDWMRYACGGNEMDGFGVEGMG